MSLRDNLTHEAVETLQAQEPVTLALNGTVGDAVGLMRDHAIGCVVVTEEERPVGVFTERDVLKKVLAAQLPLHTPVGDVMTRDPRCIEQGGSVADAIQAMHSGGFRHLPIVDGDGRLTGVVSVKRIVEYLVDFFPAAVFNLPPDPDPRQTAREGA